jgi:hypothetical protein
VVELEVMPKAESTCVMGRPRDEAMIAADWPPDAMVRICCVAVGLVAGGLTGDEAFGESNVALPGEAAEIEKDMKHLDCDDCLLLSAECFSISIVEVFGRHPAETNPPANV